MEHEPQEQQQQQEIKVRAFKFIAGLFIGFALIHILRAVSTSYLWVFFYHS